MAVATMGKKKPTEEIRRHIDVSGGNASDPAGGDAPPAADPDRESSLKVYGSEQQLIAKIAAHRNLSVKELFRSKDFQTFLRHVLLSEIRREAERLEGQS